MTSSVPSSVTVPLLFCSKVDKKGYIQQKKTNVFFLCSFASTPFCRMGGCASTWARRSSSASMHSWWPFKAANIKGVSPKSSPCDASPPMLLGNSMMIPGKKNEPFYKNKMCRLSMVCLYVQYVVIIIRTYMSYMLYHYMQYTILHILVHIKYCQNTQFNAP